MSTPIPQPPGLPLIGNLMDVDPANGIQSLTHLAAKYGPIFKLNILGRERYIVSSAALTAELCDEKRFVKDIKGVLTELRPGIGAGLFTAQHGEHDWEVAHKVLVPAFGPIGIAQMYDEMFDIASQLVTKWARIGPDTPINVTDDFTRLTLDSIALCAMDRRFNSFYSPDLHPFIGAMTDFLVEGGRRLSRTRLQTILNPQYGRKFKQDIALMQSVAKEVIAHRRANPSDKKDLLNAMLFGKVPGSSEKLSDENIMNNMITFLIAGHETTSGLLSFCLHNLLKNPSTWRKAQQEVDTVVGKGRVTYAHMSKLPYLEAVLRESLRLNPTAPAFSMMPKPGTKDPIVIGGQYTVQPNASLLVVLPALHRDPTVWGSDVEDFKPERMLGENFTNLPPGAWKPFGNGARSCIGRPFAIQEAILTMALILQNFNLRFQDPSYELKIKQTLTIKPDHLFMYASVRDGVDPIKLEKRMFAGAEESESSTTKSQPSIQPTKGGKPMTVLYGSNSGTCEGLAQSLAMEAPKYGFSATAKPLDAAVEQVPHDQPMVVITASYEGNPPDNAASFVEWLKVSPKPGTFSGADFAVFGCGHRDWSATYQKIPIVIENELLSRGGKPIIPRGETNVAEGTIFDDFDSWTASLWSKLAVGDVQTDAIDSLDLELRTSSRASHLHYSVQDAVVLKNEILTAPGAPEKRRMDIKLPSNATYEAGDYLAVLPVNNHQTISRVLKRFKLPWDATMTIRKGNHSTIPTDQELSVSAVLGSYVELGSPATKKGLTILAKYGASEEKLASVSSQPTSLLAILEAIPEIELPFATYLSMLTPMRIRQYSISSSPLSDPSRASITYSVVDDSRHLGVATNYLRNLEPSSTIQVAVKKSHTSFHLPASDSTPVIMVAAGTGLAPFYGFVQERAAKIAAGKKLGEAALFVGCRDPSQDKIYADHLTKWEAEGAVKLFYAFSRSSDDSEGCKYAQDRLWKERKYVSTLFDADARAYICGSSSLGKGVADTAARIAVENSTARGTPLSQERALKWWETLRNERYAVDVFD